MKDKQGTLNGFLDQGCTIRGDVVFADLLRVHGHVVGTVASEHELLVGEGGVVERRCSSVGQVWAGHTSDGAHNDATQLTMVFAIPGREGDGQFYFPRPPLTVDVCFQKGGQSSISHQQARFSFV